MKLLSQDSWSPKGNAGMLSTLMTFSDVAIQVRCNRLKKYILFSIFSQRGKYSVVSNVI